MIDFRLTIKENDVLYAKTVKDSLVFDKKATDMLSRSINGFVDRWVDFFFGKAVEHVKWGTKSTEGLVGDPLVKAINTNKAIQKKNAMNLGTAQTFKELYVFNAINEMEARNQSVTGKTRKELEQGKFVKVNVNKEKHIVDLVIKKVDRYGKYNTIMSMPERVQSPYQFLAVVNWFMQKGIMKNARNPRAMATFLARRVTGFYRLGFVPGDENSWDIRKGFSAREKRKRIDRDYRRTSNKTQYKKGAFFGDRNAVEKVHPDLVFDKVGKKSLDELKVMLINMAKDYLNSDRSLIMVRVMDWKGDSYTKRGKY